MSPHDTPALVAKVITIPSTSLDALRTILDDYVFFKRVARDATIPA
jgi:hypothetical protein